MVGNTRLKPIAEMLIVRQSADQWNPGKQVEFKHRRPYDKQLEKAPGAEERPAAEPFAGQESILVLDEQSGNLEQVGAAKAAAL